MTRTSFDGGWIIYYMVIIVCHHRYRYHITIVHYLHVEETNQEFQFRTSNGRHDGYDISTRYIPAMLNVYIRYIYDIYTVYGGIYVIHLFIVYRLGELLAVPR